VGTVTLGVPRRDVDGDHSLVQLAADYAVFDLDVL